MNNINLDSMGDHSKRTATWQHDSKQMFECFNDGKPEEVIQYGIKLMASLCAIMLQAQINIIEREKK